MRCQYISVPLAAVNCRKEHGRLETVADRHDSGQLKPEILVDSAEPGQSSSARETPAAYCCERRQVSRHTLMCTNATYLDYSSDTVEFNSKALYLSEVFHGCPNSLP